MKQLKSALALVLALVMVLALGGCTLNKGTTWIAKSGDVTLPSGVYILNLSSNYSSAVSVLQQMYTENAEDSICILHGQADTKPGAQPQEPVDRS